MSAIFGIFHKDGKPVTRKGLTLLDEALYKWGPDGNGIWFNEGIGLGHRMLHNTRQSLNEQLPAKYPEHPGLVITADARIDNRDELFNILLIPGSQAKEMPDSQLILLAYEKWGASCVEKLLGAFAFVIWDAANRKLFCGRDHIGFRPFYYYDTSECFIFASDIRALLASPELPCQLNQTMLAACLQIITYHALKSLTYYENIFKIPPAHHLTVSADSTQLSEYWSLENTPQIRLASDMEYAESLRELLLQAVECRVCSVFPVGSHLSGGLDSSAITVMAARFLRQSGKQLSAYSWSPPQEKVAILEDERGEIARICKQEKITCSYIDYSEQDIIRILQRDFTTEPVEMMGREQMVQENAYQNGVRVMLSGWGGDEVVSSHGRGYWAELFVRGKWLDLHHHFHQRVQKSEGNWARRARRYAGLFYRGVLPSLLPGILYGLRDPYTVNRTGALSCINPEFARRYRQQVCALRGPSLQPRADLHANQRLILENGHLTRRIEDWATSGVEKQIEYRYPLLDRRLLEFMLGIPSHLYIQDGIHRTIFRHAIEGILPTSLQWKPVKEEPAAIKLVLQILPSAVNQLYKQVRTKTPAAALEEYLDFARLDRIVPDLADNLHGSGVIINAVRLFSVKSIIN